MRIARLWLHAFGPFTNAKLAFEQKPRALELVYGPNEAGKSTTLRALTALLYGIPPRTVDAHLHDMPKLRVAGLLVDESGRELHVVRRKGAKHTLLDRHDKPLDEGVLAPFLGGLDEQLFRHMFGLDHERLRQGAEALLAGGGHVGEGLFDAGTGAQTIRRVLEQLKREADELYKARGRTPKLNAAIEALREKRRAQREAVLSPQAFVEQQRSLAEAREAQAKLTEQKRKLLAERVYLERAARLLPMLARHAVLQAELAALPRPPDAEGSWEPQLRELRARWTGAQRAAADLPKELETLALLEREIGALQARVGSAGSLSVGLDTPTRARIRKLIDTQRELTREQNELARAAAEQERAREVFLARLVEAPEEQPGERLVRWVEQVEREGLEAALSALELELAQTESALARKAQKLGVATDLGELSRLVLPEDATLTELERTYADAQRERERMQREERGHKARLAEIEEQIGELLAEGELASVEELTRVRKARDDAYQALWGGTEGEKPRRDYEALVQAADELADRLRREAQRAAQLGRLTAQRGSVTRELELLGEARASVEAQLEAVSARAGQLLSPLGLSTEDLSEARPKVHKLSSLIEQAANLAARKAAHAQLSARAEALAQELAGWMALALPAEGPRARLAHALRVARSGAEAHTRFLREQEMLRAHVHELDAKRAQNAQRAEALARALVEANERVVQEFQRLGLAPELSADEVLACLDELVELQHKTREAEALRARLSRTRTEQEVLTREIAELVERRAPGALGLPPEQALEALEQTARAEREARTAYQARAQELEALEREIIRAGDGAPLQRLRAEFEALTPDGARTRLAEIGDELEVLEQEIGALHQAIGGREAGLSLLEQPSSAVALAEEVQSELSSVRTYARRYLEVRVALSLLTQEVERYRAAHQGPVLARANALFPRLTVGRYQGLSVEYDEQDEPVLCCVRHDGRTVRVAGLSDGTRDQLYLALRVASIERFLERNPPVPLVLDDAFIHFDDQRAEAALTVLAELCTRTQVLFFTHHHRMVELAERALGRDRMVLHELDPARGVINLRDDGPLFAGT